MKKEQVSTKKKLKKVQYRKKTPEKSSLKGVRAAGYLVRQTVSARSTNFLLNPKNPHLSPQYLPPQIFCATLRLQIFI